MATDNKNFNFNEMDWEEYAKYRPHYPPLLYQRIYSHHADNGGTFDTALDVGGGAGIVSRELLQRFNHVTLSDPSELYISQAKKLFSSLPAPSKLSFLTSKMETLTPQQLPHGQVDLITAGECLHWADLPVCSAAATKLLKPNGTFSCWLYGVHASFPTDDPAYAIHEELYAKYCALYEKIIEPVGMDFKPGRTMNARFANFPFDPAEWRSVERIYTQKDGEGVYMFSPDLPKAESEVKKGEREEWLAGQGFYSEEVDYDWVLNWYVHLIPPLRPTENLKGEFEELKKAMGDRKVRLDWPGVLVIATKS